MLHSISHGVFIPGSIYFRHEANLLEADPGIFERKWAPITKETVPLLSSFTFQMEGWIPLQNAPFLPLKSKIKIDLYSD
jgi:hypothetical protein